MDGHLRFVTTLREAHVTAGRREVEVTCIRPGLSRNGNYYGVECLQQAMPLFEGARCYVDHGASTTRSVRDLAGTFRGVRIREDGALRATLRVSKSQEPLWQLIEESIAEETNLIGLSIDASAQTGEGTHAGRPCRVVERIVKLNSVDVVTRPSAGGSFDKLLEADKQSWWDQHEPYNELAAELAQASLATGVPVVVQQMPVEAGVVRFEGDPVLAATMCPFWRDGQ